VDSLYFVTVLKSPWCPWSVPTNSQKLRSHTLHKRASYIISSGCLLLYRNSVMQYAVEIRRHTLPSYSLVSAARRSISLTALVKTHAVALAVPYTEWLCWRNTFHKTRTSSQSIYRHLNFSMTSPEQVFRGTVENSSRQLVRNQVKDKERKSPLSSDNWCGKE
jgi:hypothetical protein